MPLLAQLPMEMPVLEGGERGLPVVLSAPGSASGRAFTELAERLSAGCALSPALA